MRNDEKNSFFYCNSFKEVLILFYFFIKSLMYFSIFSWEWDFYDRAENDWGGLISFYLLHFITLQLKYLNDSAYLSTVTCSSCHGVCSEGKPSWCAARRLSVCSCCREGAHVRSDRTPLKTKLQFALNLESSTDNSLYQRSWTGIWRLNALDLIEVCWKMNVDIYLEDIY